MSPVAVQSAPRRNPDLVIEPVPWRQDEARMSPSGRSSTALQNLSNARIEGVRPQMQRKSKSSIDSANTMYKPNPDVLIQGVGSPEPYGQFPNMRYPTKFDRSSSPRFHGENDSPRRSPALRSSTEPPMPPTSWRQSESPRSFYHEKIISRSPVQMVDEIDQGPKYDKMWSQAQERQSPRVVPSDLIRDDLRQAPPSPQLENPEALKALCGEESAQPVKTKKKHARKLSAKERASVFQELFPSSPYNSDFELSHSNHGSMSSNSRSSEERPGLEGNAKKTVRFESTSPGTPERPTDRNQDSPFERSSPLNSPMVDARRNLPSNQRRVSSPKTEFPPVNWPFVASSPSRQVEHDLSPEEAMYFQAKSPSPVQTNHRKPLHNAQKLMDAGFEKPVKPEESESEYVQIGYRPPLQDVRPVPLKESETAAKVAETPKQSIVTTYRPPFQDSQTSLESERGIQTKSTDQPDPSKRTTYRAPFQDAQSQIESIRTTEQHQSSTTQKSPADDAWPKSSPAVPQSLSRNYSGTNLASKAEMPKHPLSISQLPPPTPPPQFIDQMTSDETALEKKQQRNRLKKRGQSLSEGKSSKMGTFEVKMVRRVTADIPDAIKASLATFDLPESATAPYLLPASSDSEMEKKTEPSTGEQEKQKVKDMPVESRPQEKSIEKQDQTTSPDNVPKSDSKFKLTSAIASYYKPSHKNGIERSKTIPAPPTSYPHGGEKPTKPRRRSFRTSGLFGSSRRLSSEDTENESKDSVSSLATESSTATPTGRSPLTSRDSSPMRQNSDPTNKKSGSLYPISNLSSNIRIDVPSIPPIPSIPAEHRAHSPNRNSVPLSGSSTGTSASVSVSRQTSKNYPPPPDGHQWVSSADLAAFNNSGSEVIIFRRFDAVHKRVLLDMTEKIVSMEAELQQLDTLLGRVSKNESTDSSVSLSGTATPSSSSTTPNDQHSLLKTKRRDLLAALKTLLNDYDDMLLKFDSLRVLSPVEQKAGVTKFKTWLNKNGSSILPTNTSASTSPITLNTDNKPNLQTVPTTGSSPTTLLAPQFPLPPGSTPTPIPSSSSTATAPRPTKPTRASTVPLIQISPSSPPSSTTASTTSSTIPTSDKIDPQVRLAAAAIMAGKSTPSPPPPPLGDSTNKGKSKPDTVEDSNAAKLAGENLRGGDPLAYQRDPAAATQLKGKGKGSTTGAASGGGVIRKVNVNTPFTSSPSNLNNGVAMDKGKGGMRGIRRMSAR